MAKKYEDVLKEMSKLSEEEIKKRMETASKICANYCGKCPTYSGTGETKLLFCGIGKSEMIEEEKGCMCPPCPVQSEMNLRWQYYCTRGSGREQLEKEKSS